jgi:hypothetical protein
LLHIVDQIHNITAATSKAIPMHVLPSETFLTIASETENMSPVN